MTRWTESSDFLAEFKRSACWNSTMFQVGGSVNKEEIFEQGGLGRDALWKGVFPVISSPHLPPFLWSVTNEELTVLNVLYWFRVDKQVNLKVGLIKQFLTVEWKV